MKYQSQYKLSFYVPEAYLEQVKSAVFKAGAGKMGNYDLCCWQTAGTGQFRPLSNANPYLGKIGQLEAVKEWKVEMLVPFSCLTAVIQALKQVHPYETPAYDVIATLNI